jgi:putative ABC transport system permease protein
MVTHDPRAAEKRISSGTSTRDISMHILKLLFRNALRHKLRTFLTVLGLTIAILAFGLLRTVVSAWYAGVEASSASRLITRNAISLVFTLPSSYREKIRQIEGVRTVSWGNWFGGIYIEEKNFFPNFAIDPKTYLELYPEFVLSPEEEKAFLIDRRGCVAGRKIVERFRWKIGDVITLRGPFSPGIGSSCSGGYTTGNMTPRMRPSSSLTGSISTNP